MSYSAAERETTLQTDDESGKWIVDTYQSKIQTKLRKVGVEPVFIGEDGRHKYELDFNQVSFRSGKKREMSEEQKEKAAERMRKLHQNKKEEINQ